MCGIPIGSLSDSSEIRYWKDGWVDEVAYKLRNRNITIENDKEHREIRTCDKYEMEWAIDYVNIFKNKIKPFIGAFICISYIVLSYG